MADPDDDYVYDDASGEWIPAAEAAAKKAAAEVAAGAVEVRDSVGNLLADLALAWLDPRVRLE